LLATLLVLDLLAFDLHLALRLFARFAAL